MSDRLAGKVAVVTGGASGIGEATVRRFVEEGARVVLCDLDVERGAALAGELGEASTFVDADVSDSRSLCAAIDEAVIRYGGLDIMYNNAGIDDHQGSIVDCPPDVFDRIIDVNLRAVWLGIKLAAPKLIDRGGGSIISTASIAGMVGMPGQCAYGAAKAGVMQLTRGAAIELAPHLVRVNCICPGGIATPLVWNNPSLPAPLDPAELRAALVTSQPLPRAGRPDDIAWTAVWLASEESAFVTGQAIVVDGGMTVEFDARFRGQLGLGDEFAARGRSGSAEAAT